MFRKIAQTIWDQNLEGWDKIHGIINGEVEVSTDFPSLTLIDVEPGKLSQIL